MSVQVVKHPAVRLYRKKPIEIEAIQYTEDTQDEVMEFLTCVFECHYPTNNSGNPYIEIETLEGNHMARFGDWIIKGVEGEFYPCKDSIFRRTYDVV